MPALKLETMGGMLPAWGPRLLPTGQASYSKNAFLFSGELIGWRRPSLLRALTNSAARMVYRVPTVSQAQARAYLVFKLQPNDGDTIVIGDLTYTFRTALATQSDGRIGLPFEVLIGADTHTTATHLAQAITADSGENTNSGVTYGEDTPLNGDTKYYLPNTDHQPGLLDPTVTSDTIGVTLYTFLIAGAKDFGAAYNLIKVSESTSAARLTWLYDTVALTDTTTVFRGGTNPSFDSAITGPAAWLEFVDPDTNVVRSPVVDDQFNRYYFASPSQMPGYNTYDRIQNGDASWLLGVPPPGCAPTLDVTGGGNNLTLGNTTTTSLDVNALGNHIYLVKITTPGATQIQDVKFNTGPGAPAEGYAAAHFAAVVYADESGAPGTLLNVGQVITGVITTDVNVSTFLNPTNLSENLSYWVGIAVDITMALNGGPADGTGSTVAIANTFSNGPVSQAAGLSSATAGIQMWADLVTSDVLETRSYVYTWVSAYGEEGPPSPPVLLDGWSNGTWTLGLWQPPPDDTGILRNLKKINIYRTVSGQTSTVFFFVATVDIGTATYVDIAADSVVALNDQLQSTNWFPPPATLQGLAVMQNGMVAGFTGNEIWFCEPYHIHAWPPQYVLTTDFPIVGLGVTNGALVVCTSARPYVISGNAPAQLAQTQCADANPCLSRGSILGGDAAVTYMSPNGLIQVTVAGVATNTTDLWMTREKWQQLVPQKNTRAVMLTSSYYCLGSVSPDGTDNSVAQQGFTIELAQDNSSFTIWPQPGGHRLGLQLLDSPVDADVKNVVTDPWTGSGLLVASGNVYYFNFADTAPALKSYTWRSKVYQQNAKRNYTAMKVFFTVPPGTPTQNATRIEEDADAAVWLAPLPADSYGFLKTYVDKGNDGSFTLIDCREIRKSGELLRIVDGFKTDSWYWEVVGRVNISNIQIATSAKELAQV